MKRVIQRGLRVAASNSFIAKLFQSAGRELCKAGYDVENLDIATNGERWLIDKVSKQKGTIIDVGANSGQWAKEVLSSHSNADVYCVEAIPDFADKIRNGLSGRVTVVEQALSDRPGKVTIYRSGGGAKAGAVGSSKEFKEYQLTAKTGDSLVRDCGIEQVSFIKIDVDGFDLPVLLGFENTIERCRPVIQFEYSRFWIASKSHLATAYEFLESKDYKVGRLRAGGVVFKGYSHNDEMFMNMNFAAVPFEKAYILEDTS